MIQTGRKKGWNSHQIAAHVNSSIIAAKLQILVTPRSIATKLGNYTRDRS